MDKVGRHEAQGARKRLRGSGDETLPLSLPVKHRITSEDFLSSRSDILVEPFP